jgi:hypothetical protein
MLLPTILLDMRKNSGKSDNLYKKSTDSSSLYNALSLSALSSMISKHGHVVEGCQWGQCQIFINYMINVNTPGLQYQHTTINAVEVYVICNVEKNVSTLIPYCLMMASQKKA